MADPHPPETIEDLAERLKPGDRLAGLDLGSKTIGIAVSDTLQQVATPHSTIKRGKFARDAEALCRIIADNEIVAIVLGLPVNMDGSAGPRVQSTRAFARNLAPLIDIPVVYWDERLSTAAVERMLIEADASRARRAELVDKLAAAYILQGALDRLKALKA
ncbi:MAG: Holliday junction resolvase RuvX [Aestuariivirgaceae bacterium]